MSHNRTTDFSPPFRRNNLLSLRQYAASDQFHTLGKWDRARPDDLYVVRGTEARTQPVQIVVVGSISSDKSFLHPHGNYDPNYMKLEDIGRRAKLQFILTCPEEDPDFSADYAMALQRLRAIQDDIAGSEPPGRKEHFIENNNLKMNFYLFHQKDITPQDDDSDGKSDTDENNIDDDDAENTCEYEVASSFRTAWETVSYTHYNNIMEVYGTDEKAVNYKQFDKRLASGTLVVVTFTLKHFSIRERGSSRIVSDTYCASVVSVSILKDATKTGRRPTRSLPTRRPVPVSQAPSWQTLQYAADTFAPLVKQTPVDVAVVNASTPIEDAKGDTPDLKKSQMQSKSSVPLRSLEPVALLRPGQLPGTTALPIDNFIPTPELLDHLMPFLLERLHSSTSSLKTADVTVRQSHVGYNTQVRPHLEGNPRRILPPTVDGNLEDSCGVAPWEVVDSPSVTEEDAWVNVPSASSFVIDPVAIDRFQGLGTPNHTQRSAPDGGDHSKLLQLTDNITQCDPGQPSVVTSQAKRAAPSKKGPGRPSKASKRPKV